jgi:tetratricopeptide (TPR) repeat protein
VASTIDGAWYQGDDPHGLNEVAFYFFGGCADPKLLRNALNWSNMAIKLYEGEPNFELAEYWDTKANLLYRLGQKKEALLLEQKALNINPKAKDIADNFSKMKKGLPTWNINASK